MPPILPVTLASRLAAEAQARGTTVAQLLPELVEQALDADELSLEGQRSGEHLTALQLLSDYVAVSYAGQPDDNGELDHEQQQRDVAEINELLGRAGLPTLAPHAVRDFEVGRGAQGEPFTWMVLAESLTAIFGLIAAPAVAYAAWKKVVPDIREWLKRRNGRASRAFVEACCLEDARSRVEYPDELVPALVHSHCSTAFFAEIAEKVPVGPYCVTIPVAERKSVFVYITDEVGTLLHFHELASDAAGGIVAEENERNR